MRLPSRKSIPLYLVYLSILSLSFINGAHSQEGAAARLDSAEGEVTSRIGSATEFTPITSGALLNSGDVIRTGRLARAGILFKDGFLLRLAENTTIEIKPPSGSSGQTLSLESGKAFFFSREPKEFPTIASPSVTTAVRGTEFAMQVSKEQTVVSVLDGRVECSNDFGKLALVRGEEGVTELGKAPIKRIMVQQVDAVQWALDYPVIISLEDLEGMQKNDQVSNKVKLILEAMKSNIDKGDHIGALKLYEAYHAQSSNTLDFYAANLYLALGQVDNATVLLDRVSNSSKDSATSAPLVSALRAIILIAKGDKKSARQLLDKPEVKSSRLGAVMLSEAYLMQSEFNLEQSKIKLEQLLQMRPNDPNLIAKLAELELAFGEVERAEQILNKTNTENASILSLRGFIALTKDESQTAHQRFEQAVLNDDSYALARLGLGLSKIRSGDLEGGRLEIQKAAYLEPTTALFRSYLGKAYFEEERENLAGHEYERAIELDPNDPTPYLYRAYNNLSQNRPVDALKDVEKSIQLNQSRAVYRSRLLLDQDLGVRSAGLAEVFSNLGFGEVARVEAIRSLNRDYTNYSAHRFLAGSYNTIILDDASIAESRLANLLSPLSFNLIQSQPSSDSSLNEYSALFDKVETRYETGLELSSADDEISPSVAVTHKGEQYGYLLSYDGLLTGGSRSTNFAQRQRSELALQYQPIYDQRFLLNGSGVYFDQSDDRSDFNEVKFEDWDISLGYTNSIAPKSKLIAEAAFSNQRHNFLSNSASREAFFTGFLPSGELAGELDLLVDQFARERVKSFRGTTQYLYDSDLVGFVLGSQIYFSDTEREERSRILDSAIYEDLNYELLSDGYNDLNSYDLYSYTTWHLSRAIDFNLGVNFTEVEFDELELPPFVSDTRSATKISPKVGITLYPQEETTIRAAYFEGIRKSSLEDTSSLEPTLVGGINQRFTDTSGIESRNVGLALDHKISGSTYFGVEGLWRHTLDRGTISQSSLTADFDQMTHHQSVSILGQDELHFEEFGAKTYLYQVITDSLVGGLDYYWSGVSGPSDIYEGDQDRQLNRITASLRYFDISGFFLFGKSSWREQNLDLGSEDGADSNEDFMLFDAGVGYRIPKRHGSIILQCNNIFDQDFTYDQSLGLEEFVRPDFSVSLLAKLNF